MYAEGLLGIAHYLHRFRVRFKRASVPFQITNLHGCPHHTYHKYSFRQGLDHTQFRNLLIASFARQHRAMPIANRAEAQGHAQLKNLSEFMTQGHAW